jgi:glycosyltransferase involved in cell wall biosynthesis
MGFGTNKKLKVVWICHFSNIDIQNKLKVRNRISEYAPWITFGILEAKKRNDIELHIISPHRWISGIKELQDGNIFYHFFNSGIPFTGRHWPDIFRWDVFTNFYLNRKRIKRITEKITPDIIHWHGAENTYFSSSFFDLYKNYPYLVTIQGFVGMQQDNHKFLTRELRQKIKIEKQILSIAEQIGVRTNEMSDIAFRLNEKANQHWHNYFGNFPMNVNLNELVEKKYDIIFFARVVKLKGIEDLINACGLLKPLFPEIKVAIIGPLSEKYRSDLEALIIKNNCGENIKFLGHFSDQNDIYKYVVESKITVIPTHVDIIPGTIIESMFRGIPVVSYKIGGIPQINQEDEIILLVEKGDISGLAEKIKALLIDSSYCRKMGEKAYNYAIKTWNNSNTFSDVMNIYYKILKYED